MTPAESADKHGDIWDVALDRALERRGGFDLRPPDDSSPDEGLISPDVRRHLEQFRGRAVFWQLGNTCSEVTWLLQALRCGIVPILTSPEMPELQRRALKKTYSAFAEFNGRGIIGPQTTVTADPRLWLGFQTSGSTGIPRIVAATKNALLAGVTTMHDVQQLEHVARAAVLLPLHFAFAFINQLLWAVLYEREILVLPGLGFPAATLAKMVETRASMICLVPPQIQVLRVLGASAPPTTHMQVVNVAGGPFPSACFSWLREKFPLARIINNYGCTEALTRIASCEVTGPGHQPTNGGRPFPGLDLRIAGDRFPGRIEFRGPSASLGYVRPDGGIDEHGDWIGSGDFGYLKDGRVQVLGRHDQLFKSGGEKLSLVEVEHALMSVGEVMHAIAWAAQREGADQAPQAVIHGPCRPTSGDLQMILKRSLSPNAWPHRIYWAAHWTCLSNGKPDRLRLQEQAVHEELEVIWESPRRPVE